MNLLSRKLSTKSNSSDKDPKDHSSSDPADRTDDGSRPSLLRRLSRRSSKSKENTSPEGTNKKPALIDVLQSEDPDEKTTEPMIEEIGPGAATKYGRASESGDALLSPAGGSLDLDFFPTHGRDSDPSSDQTGGGTGITSAMPRESTPTVEEHPVEKEKDQTAKPPHKHGLTKEDVQQLFSGAPQFILEKGRRGRFFPQAFFPWNNDLETSDLQDRRYLRHETFALSTLHAHLPIPDEVGWKPGMSHPKHRDQLETGKRPMFELGIYERPNMLGVEGAEKGTVGMRYFLERPVADGLRDDNLGEHGKDLELDFNLATAPATEAFKMLAINIQDQERDAKIGKHAPEQSRARLVQEGPHAWKSVGVRNITMKFMAERLQEIGKLRDEVIAGGWRVTVLDKITSGELHQHLFTEILYPPRKLPSHPEHNKEELKLQIEALVKVLTTPGAWLDMSHPEARLRFGKILHSRKTQSDGDASTFHIDPERKWLLIQLLLSVELVIRLDAALRVGIALHQKGFEITAEEIHHFNKLRNLKVDWDLVAARRFLHLCYIKPIERRTLHPTSPLETPQSPGSKPHHSFFSGLRQSLGLDKEAHDESLLDACDIAILPRQGGAMVEGLYRFACNIYWPRAEEINQRLQDKICCSDPVKREKFLMDAISIVTPTEPPSYLPHGITPSIDTFSVDLHTAEPSNIGGWLSHSWLSGLIMPGNSICDILMSTLLENDTDESVLTKLGKPPHANHAIIHPLRSSGFVLDGSSWWSKSCIVGRVIAPMKRSRESMGWIYAPNFVPWHDSDNKPVGSRWVKVKTFPVPAVKNHPRIFDGDKVAQESTPLGMGKGGIMGEEFRMVTDAVLDGGPEVEVSNRTIHLSVSDATVASPDHPLAAWASIDISITRPADPSSTTTTRNVRLGLNRAVYFVSAYPCRPPHGHVVQHHNTTTATTASTTTGGGNGSSGSGTSTSKPTRHPTHKPHEHIPAHPLHHTYHFVTKSLADLVDGSRGVEFRPGEVVVIDARHHNPYGRAPEDTPASAEEIQQREKDIFVRAWCAEQGKHALIARVGRTCLSCAVREARALEISVVVRVGNRE